MATVTAFDRINKLEKRRLTYREYYAPMDLSPPQKRKREEVADAIEDDLLFLFALYMAARQYDREVQRETAIREYKARLLESLKDFALNKAVLDAYLQDILPEEVRVTAERYKDDDYWTSYDRAITIAQNDSNILWNGTEYQNAVDSGKTMKQWLTMKDERVRPTHVQVDDTVLPIDEPFVVGGSLMMFPMDTSLGAGADEISNCRCSVTYL